MKFIKVKTYEELSARAAEIISAQVVMKPQCVLGLATGSSPLGTYAILAEKYERGELDFQKNAERVKPYKHQKKYRQ